MISRVCRLKLIARLRTKVVYHHYTVNSSTMQSVCLTTLGEDAFAIFLQSFDTVLVDCDGVLWLGTTLIPGAEVVLKKFRDMGKRVFYVTNNSTKSRTEFVEKCKKLGFHATEDEILASSYLTACFLNDIGFNKQAYVVGSSGITKELDIIGIKHNKIGPDPMMSDIATFTSQVTLEPDIGAVIVGFDEHISYPKILKAATYLKNPDCLFLATNRDEQFPAPGDIVLPGAGTMVATVSCCTGREPILIGKPGSYVKDFLTKHHNINPNKTLMIGDRGNTDILLGTRCGFQTLMVLTGVTSLKDIEDWENSDNAEIKGHIPKYFVNSLSDLVPLLFSL